MLDWSAALRFRGNVSMLRRSSWGVFLVSWWCYNLHTLHTVRWIFILTWSILGHIKTKNRIQNGLERKYRSITDDGGGRNVSQSSRVVLLQHQTDTNPQREQTALLRPHAYILAHSLVTASSSLSLFFFSFFSLACSGGGGGYIDPVLSWWKSLSLWSLFSHTL